MGALVLEGAFVGALVLEGAFVGDFVGVRVGGFVGEGSVMSWKRV